MHSYTPSAVSQQLAALEREAGVALLERSGRRVVLTGAGEVLVRHAAAVLSSLEAATAALAAVREGPAGPLRIGAFPSVVRTILPAVLVALGRSHPRLELMVTELDPAGVPAALRDRRLDAGLVHEYVPSPGVGGAPGPASVREAVGVARGAGSHGVAGVACGAGSGGVADDLESVALLDEAVHLAVPAGVDARHLDDLRDRDWIMASPGTLCHEATMRVCQGAGFTPRVRHQADDFDAVLALVAAGQGVSLVPALATGSLATGLAASGLLATGSLPGGVRLIAAPTRRRTRIAFRRGTAANPAIAELVSALRTAVNQLPPQPAPSQ
ncbi:DNA-binding transcriptional LysR family regulator [Actinoplanes lutulentus]|uniref:DNA-binding transcriptional LysR family regulator n=1 Tax=Actinoplanes lutulentus TaxID=1287878 RepID=A0A327Z4X6_9ACTN|nr:DNA-binding transcriptional LysR family regulator [Actinoplanes lutulentus]